MSRKTRLPRALLLMLAAGSLLQCERMSEEAAAPGVEPGPDAAIWRFGQLWVERVGIYGDSRFLGVQTLQNPTDAWVTQEIIHEVKPDFIVETGTYKGGSALFWAMVLKEVNPAGRVITIDIADNVSDAKQRAIWAERVDFLVGSSTEPRIVYEVTRLVEGKRVLVILDSLHTADHVYDELRAYSPLVDVGSYVIVQDTGLGPAITYGGKGVQRFLEENTDFEIDKKRERFMITNNPRGYLRRVR